jgi:hypothetical protein
LFVICKITLELARAYETLARKVHQIESVIKLATPLSNGIQDSNDLETLVTFLRETKMKADVCITS